MLEMMVVGRLDPSVWNLGVPAMLLAACGPVVVGGGGGGSADDGTAGETGTTDGDSHSGSATSPSTSASTGTTSSVECEGPQDCPPGYSCIDGMCDYEVCADGGAEFGCGYDCYSAYECDSGDVCQYGVCTQVEPESSCDGVPFALSIPIEAVGVRSLAFIDVGAADRGLLVGGAGTQLVRVDGTITTIDEDAIAEAMAVGDLDADGDEDLAMATNDGRVRIVLQQGSWLPSELGQMRMANLVAIADSEADGFPDVFASSGVTDTVVFRNEGPGGWLDAQMVGEPLSSLARGSLDGDLDEDVLMQGQRLDVLVAGDLEHPIDVPTPALISLRVLAVGDFDQSGEDDVAMFDAVNGTSFVTVMRSPVLASAGAATTWWPAGVSVLATGDLDGDGDPDVVGADGDQQLAIGWGSNEPGLDLFSCVSTMQTELEVTRLAVGDFTGDGRNDIAISDGTGVQVLARTD